MTGKLDEWNELIENPQNPLTTRSQALYPPGSIFKLIVGLVQEANIVSRERTIAPGTMNTIIGGILVGESWAWKIELRGCSCSTCNVTFYTLGLELGQDRIIDMARRLGLKRILGLIYRGESWLLPTLEETENRRTFASRRYHKSFYRTRVSFNTLKFSKVLFPQPRGGIYSSFFKGHPKR